MKSKNKPMSKFTRIIAVVVSVVALLSLLPSCSSAKLAGTHYEITDYFFDSGGLDNFTSFILFNARYYVYFTTESEGYFQGENSDDRRDDFTYTVDGDTVYISFNERRADDVSLNLNADTTMLISDKRTLLSSLCLRNSYITYTKC